MMTAEQPLAGSAARASRSRVTVRRHRPPRASRSASSTSPAASFACQGPPTSMRTFFALALALAGFFRFVAFFAVAFAFAIRCPFRCGAGAHCSGAIRRARNYVGGQAMQGNSTTRRARSG
ncbi:MAG: hypothetical protein AMK72_04230 [Planctomycetes bacterium SM23_25]|nr:MAG: hypothetical protein AMK72_04230 [Planctomycetes bacterium SM23_25]